MLYTQSLKPGAPSESFANIFPTHAPHNGQAQRNDPAAIQHKPQDPANNQDDRADRYTEPESVIAIRRLHRLIRKSWALAWPRVPQDSAFF